MKSSFVQTILPQKYECPCLMLNSKPAASEICAVSFSMVWQRPDIYQCSFCNQTALIPYYMLLRLHTEAARKCLGSTAFCISVEKLRLKQSSYPDVSSPLRLGLITSSVTLLTYSWEVEEPENMTEQDPGRHPHKHIFILQLKFLRGPNLRDPIIGNFKEIKQTS